MQRYPSTLISCFGISPSREQGRNQRHITRGGCQMERSLTRRIAGVHIFACPNEKPHRFCTPLNAGSMKHRLPQVGPVMDVCTLTKQCFNDFRFIIGHGQVQRRDARFVWRIDLARFGIPLR